jgi:hypothetical protein
MASLALVAIGCIVIAATVVFTLLNLRYPEPQTEREDDWWRAIK